MRWQRGSLSDDLGILQLMQSSLSSRDFKALGKQIDAWITARVVPLHMTKCAFSRGISHYLYGAYINPLDPWEGTVKFGQIASADTLRDILRFWRLLLVDISPGCPQLLELFTSDSCTAPTQAPPLGVFAAHANGVADNGGADNGGASPSGQFGPPTRAYSLPYAPPYVQTTTPRSRRRGGCRATTRRRGRARARSRRSAQHSRIIKPRRVRGVGSPLIPRAPHNPPARGFATPFFVLYRYFIEGARGA